MAEIRTFIAVEVDQAILARLSAVQQHLRTAEAQVSWTRTEGMHLTLKFLGSVPESRLPEIAQALELAAGVIGPFRVSVASTGGFPNLSRMRVVWAGIDTGAEELRTLADAVDARLAERGFPREERPFSPHITLGRVKAPEGGDRLAQLVRTHQAEAYGEMLVSEIHLLRSDLSPTGARYTVLRAIGLSGS